MTNLKVLEFRKHYIDNLEEWIEIPIWDQAELTQMVNKIDWEELPLDSYKRMLVENLPGLSAQAKIKLKNLAVQNELYDVLIYENWGLSPAMDTSYYSEVEQENVQLWYRSNGLRGQKPSVI